ncbi:MAG: hypothetical protein ACRCTI_02890 [Beijerinckiaceae bacterium]
MAVLRIFLTVMALALFGAGLGFVLFWWTSRPSIAVSEPIAVTVGNASFAIPPGYVRDGALPRPGAQERVDLALRFPELTPVQRGGSGQAIFVALLREDGVVDPSRRVTEIYGRFLEPDIWQNPGGLLLRRFTTDSPYGDEELFISPPDGDAFSARCRKPQAAPRAADIGEACIWRYRANGADVQTRFSPDLLPQWEALTEGVRRKVAEWRR